MPQKMNLRSENRPGAQKLRDRLREATSEAILGAAERVFAAQGLHAAKMDAIATEAGVAVGTLYNHFRDRESLLAALVTARRTELLERLDTALSERAHDPFPDQLRSFVMALVEHWEAHQQFLSIMIEVEASRDAKTVLIALSKPRHTMEEIYLRVGKLIDRGLKQKALRREDSELFSTLLMGMLRGCMVRRLFYGKQSDTPLEQQADQITRFFLHGAGI